MPALLAFGRRWRIGSDDFVFPALTEAFVRFSWIVLGIVAVCIHYPFECETGRAEYELAIYLIVLLVINVSSTLLCLVMARISSKGCIMDPSPRSSISVLLYIRLPLFIVEFVWTIVATINVFKGYDICHFIIFLRVVVSLEWALIIAVTIGLLIVFNPSKSEDEMSDGRMSRGSWRHAFRLLRIREESALRVALTDIATLISSFFVDRNLVLSDIAAGLLLVVHSPNNEYSPTKQDPRPIPSWMTARSALHYLHFATCVYGWPTYLMHNPSCKGYCSLARNVKCCGKVRCDQVLVVEDNCCLCNTASVRLSTKDKNIDLFFVSFRNRLYEVPFLVLADHESHSIVVAIRGSCSLVDLITDLSLDDEVFTIDVDADPVLATDRSLDPSDGSEVRVHRGMLRGARYVYDTLKKHSVIDDLLVLNPSYSLVICGHSLGAGVASLLTLLLKQDFPSIRCFAFSPPGCVISQNGEKEMEEHVMSVIGGDDVVPRISYQSMHKLRENVEIELRVSTRAKYEILLKGIFRLFFKTPWELAAPLSGDNGTDTLNLIGEGSRGSGYGTQSSSQLRPTSINMTEERIQSLPQQRESSDSGFSSPLTIPSPSAISQTSIFTISKAPERISLYPPGRCLHVTPISSDSKEVKAEWIDYKCLSEVKLSASVLSDHLPKSVIAMLEKLVESEDSGETVEIVTEQPQPNSS